jgi:hypothetical protein
MGEVSVPIRAISQFARQLMPPGDPKVLCPTLDRWMAHVLEKGRKDWCIPLPPREWSELAKDLINRVGHGRFTNHSLDALGIPSVLVAGAWFYPMEAP